MAIDQARQDHLATGVDHPPGRCMLLLQVFGFADRDDLAVPDSDGAGSNNAPLGIHSDDPIRIPDEDISHIA